MVQERTVGTAPVTHAGASVRKIRVRDIRDVLARGVDDFSEKPSHLVFLTIIYPLIAIILARATFGYGLLPLLFPLAAGFALVGPVAAIGLYELSRRRERGEDIDWRHALAVLRSPSIGEVLELSIILLALFVLWLLTAQGIYTALFGDAPPQSVDGFVRQVLSTSRGWTLILVGNSVGFLFALVVLAVSAISFPMLLDRKVGVGTAVTTSIRAMIVNPGPMLAWGFVVAVALLLGSIPFFVGLCVVLPILGHATWHLYRKLVV